MRDIYLKLGEYFLSKCDGDEDKAIDRMLRLFIDIKMVDGCVVVYTARPGLLIGRKGETYRELEQVFGGKFKIIEKGHIVDEVMFALRSSKLQEEATYIHPEHFDLHYDVYPEPAST